MAGNSAKKLINWHTGWLGERDANGDLVGDWAQYFDKEQFKCRYCDVERKYSNGGRSSLIQHSESGKHKKILTSTGTVSLSLSHTQFVSSYFSD